MADKFDKVKPGDVLWEKTLNDRMARVLGTGPKYGYRPVKILSVDDRENGLVTVSWNGNQPTQYTRREVNKLQWKDPPHDS